MRHLIHIFFVILVLAGCADATSSDAAMVDQDVGFDSADAESTSPQELDATTSYVEDAGSDFATAYPSDAAQESPDRDADTSDLGPTDPDASDPNSPDVTENPPPVDTGPTDYPLPAIPSNCQGRASIMTYNPNGWSHLLDAFEANATPCANYYIFLPAVAGNKTQPRGGTGPADVRSREGRFHAVAEFHWGAWSKVTNMTWYQKGVEFRRRMTAAGYNVPRGDTWAINELPSSTKTDPAVRNQVRQLVKGLYDGPPGSPKRAGSVFVIGMGMNTVNHSVYKPALKSWLTDAAFWADMDNHVLWWSQETYVNPKQTCVAGAQIGVKAQHVNEFIHHKARLAASGPSGAQNARAFFNQAYVPTLTAVWHSDVYGATQIPLEPMKKLVSLQVYANRAWANSHSYPDRRLAIAWDNNAPNSTVAQRRDLADRLAAAVAGAYGPGGEAQHACSPSGAYTWCGCETNGAAFNQTWANYDSW